MVSGKPGAGGMHAFDYVILLFSFVYAAAVTHVLATIGDLIIAGRRVRLSWLNLGWMSLTLLSVLAWWMATWELRDIKAWNSSFIIFNFAMACALYLVVRLTCPHVPATGKVYLREFHLSQGPKYLGATTIFGVGGMIYNAVYDVSPSGFDFLRQDIAIAPMALAGAVAALFIRRPRVQVACLLVEALAWVIYFAKFETSLSG